VSVLEDLRNVEERVAARLQELQPLVEEYEELRRIADRLGLDVNTAQPKPTKPAKTRRVAAKRAGATSTRRRSTRRRAGGTQATGQERRERVLEMIKERPGITVPDISATMGVDAPSLYRVVRKLVADGTVKKEGKQLTLA
jgi:predicted HTH transcriptional regulator